jgi:zinc protease
MERSGITTAMYEVSGVQVVHRFTPGKAVVSVRLYLLGGSRRLTEETQGIEPLALRAAEIGDWHGFAKTGSRAVLEATHDWTVTGFRGLRSDIDSTWHAWSRRLLEPVITDAALAEARGELLVNARDRYGHPERRIHQLAWQHLFAQHPYRFDPWGTEASLNGLTADQLRQHGANAYGKGRMLLVVVGDVIRAEVTRLVSATLARLRDGGGDWLTPEQVTPDDVSWLVEDRLLPTNYVLGYFVGPPPGHDDYYVFEVATNILSSRLRYAIRTSLGLSYATSARVIEGGVTVGAVSASTRDPVLVRNLMFSALLELQQFRGSASSLKRFADQFALEELAQNMTVDNQAEALARATIYFGDFNVADQRIKRLKDVRAREIRAVAKKYMSHIRMAYLGDTALMSGRW